jgi:hypothetical protein
LALDSLAAGGEVDLTPGRYIIREPIMLREDHQVLRGCGAETVLFLAEEANCPVVILGSPLCGERVEGVRLEALVIDGNRTKQQKEVWCVLADGAGVYNNGVDVWNVDGATVTNVVCSHCRSGGLVCCAGTRRLTVRNFTAFDNQFDGLACYDTEESDLSGLNLHDNLSAGISLDLNFNQNVIHNAELAGNDLGVFMRQSLSNVFDGLTIRDSRHFGVFMAQAVLRTDAGWLACPGSECAGNIFNNLSILHCGDKAFLVNDASCTNNVISGSFSVEDTKGGLTQAVEGLVSLRVAAHDPTPHLVATAMPAIGAVALQKPAKTP